MGASDFVNSRLPRSVRGGLDFSRLNIDIPLLGIMIALVVFGFLMVYSASPLPSALMGVSADYFVKRQILWALLGAAFIAVMLVIDYHWLKRLSVLMMLGTLGMLLVVEVFGSATLGADRSILGASIRPSELAKLVTIIYVAVWLDAKRDVLNDITFGLIPLIGMLAIMGFLIVIQPDLSAGLTIIVLGGLLFFLAGGEWRQLAFVILVTLVVLWILVQIYPTGMRRITEFIAGLQDPTKASDHIKHSFQAIIGGGIFGTGIGQGSAKYIGLPVAHTDSIFAVVAEETGLVGVLALIAAYVGVLWRGLKIAQNAPDHFGRILAAGITFWILLEAFLNIGVMVNLLPNAGNALPFISYGGSSLLTAMTGIGILLSISRKSDQKQAEGENTFASVVDLRWRDRRRRVSRSVRSANSR